MRVKGFVTLAVLSLVFLHPVAAEKRAFEISDYYRTAFVGSPVASPDGARIAFPVTRYELEKGESWTEIWVVKFDGSDLRQMTQGRHHDGSPVFSPDGKQLLFVSDRSGDTIQLFVMPVDGGEPKQLTSYPVSLSGPVWSPDGKHIAVSADVYPECGADDECNSTLQSSVEAGPLAARVTEELLYRHWTSWREGKYTHVLLVNSGTGEVVRDLTPGHWDSPSFGLSGNSGYAFSPDSSEICVVSNHDSDQASSTNSDLWLVPVETGPVGRRGVNITAANLGWDGNPVYSPDGRYIAFRSQKTPGYESDLYRIGIFDREKKQKRYLTDSKNFDDWINDFAWAPDGKALFFSAHKAGETPLFRVAIDGGKVQQIHADGAIAGWALRADGASIVYSRSRVGEPPEIFTVPTRGGETSVQLSALNDELRNEVDIRPAEVLWMEGENERRIQVFVVKPHDFDPNKKYPLILNVHGGPQSPWKDRYRGDWQVYPGKGYVVAFPNPTGSAGFGQDYIDAISCDWGGQVFDDLMKITDSLAELPFVDADRMGAMGWSYGGYMMMWFEGHTKRFKAIASMMGVYDLRSMWGATEELWFVEHDLCGKPWESDDYKKWSPSEFAKDFSTPTLVITGERDYRVPYTQSLHFFTDLQVMDVPSRLVVYPNSGHWPSWYEMAFYYLVHLDWFHQWLDGEPPPWDPQAFLRNQVFSKSESE